MARVIDVPEREYQPGTRDTGPNGVSIPDDATRVEIELTRVNWPDTGSLVIDGEIEVSMDGGQSWRRLLGIKDYGGVVNSPRTGAPKPATWGRVDLPPGTGRRLRGRVTNTVALRTAVSLSVL